MEIFELLGKSLQYGFIQKALICGILIGLSASLLGIFLVLRKLSLISDGLSHVSFATVALALAVGVTPIFVSIPLIILASFLINKLTEKAHIYSDSAIGLVSALSLSCGVIIISTVKGFNVDINGYLFGSILAIEDFEAVISVIIALAVIGTIVIFFNDLFLLTYDPDYARISKVNQKLINIIFSIIQSVTIVIGVKIVGAMLMSSLIIFPVIAALQISKNFKTMIFLSSIISVSSVVIGIFISFIFNIPTGATIVLVNGISFTIFFIINKLFKVK